MPCHTADVTNQELARVAKHIEQLIEWAEADAEHATANDAPGIATADRARAAMLRKAVALVKKAWRANVED